MRERSILSIETEGGLAASFWRPDIRKFDLRAKHMPPDSGNNGPGTDPLVGGGFGIVIVDGAARGVPAVEGVLGRPVSAFRHRLVELAVIQAGKGPLLINDPGQSIWKRGMTHPVEHHRAIRYLAGIGFPPRFGGDQSGQQVVVAGGVAAGAAAPRVCRGAENAHSLQSGRARDARRRSVRSFFENRSPHPGSLDHKCRPPCR